MRNLFLLVVIVLVFCLNSCSSQFVISGETKFVSEVSNGIIKVKSTGYAANENDAIINAEVNAFEVLFFRGISGSDFDKPLIGFDEVAIKEKHQDYFELLYEQQRFKTFIQQKVIVNNTKQVKSIKSERYKVDLLLDINAKALKTELENKNIIRKFGL